jgi:hypothetical protein
MTNSCLKLLACAVSVALGLAQFGCTERNIDSAKGTESSELSPEDKLLRYKFRDIGGVERRLDALERINSLTIYNENGVEVEFKAGTDRDLRSTSFFSGGEFVVPKNIRAVWYENMVSPNQRGGPLSGKVLGDYTVPVASRIPVELLDNLREHRGTLRLKIRIAPDDVLIGWDIERRPRDPSLGPNVGVPPVFSMVGGDFQEAEIFNGQVVRKGWYIDKKTGRKIETDF